MHLASFGLLGLGMSPDSFGQTLALLITFLGIGVVVNVLVVYIVGQVLNERRENLERIRQYDELHRTTR